MPSYKFSRFSVLNMRPLSSRPSPVFAVALPPEKAEGCENYLHSEEAEQDVLRDATKAAGKKRISLDV